MVELNSIIYFYQVPFSGTTTTLIKLILKKGLVATKVQQNHFVPELVDWSKHQDRGCGSP
jgi:hypothetical protein